MGKGGADTDFEVSKWGTLLTSLFTAVSGMALIGLGVYALLNPLGSAFIPITLPIIVISVGVLVFILSTVGCFSTVVEARKVLMMYFGILLVLTIFQFVIGILALTTRGEMIGTALDMRWDTLYNEKPRFIRDVEETYACCGLYNLTDRAWPKVSANVTRNTCSENPDFGYQIPCIKPVMADWEGRQSALGIGILVLASLQLIGLIPTYYFAYRLPTADQYGASLREEYDRLLPGAVGAGGRAPAYGSNNPASRLPAQHSVTAPAGSHVQPTSRAGARVG